MCPPSVYTSTHLQSHVDQCYEHNALVLPYVGGPQGMALFWYYNTWQSCTCNMHTHHWPCGMQSSMGLALYKSPRVSILMLSWSIKLKVECTKTVCGSFVYLYVYSYLRSYLPLAKLTKGICTCALPWSSCHTSYSVGSLGVHVNKFCAVIVSSDLPG